MICHVHVMKVKMPEYVIYPSKNFLLRNLESLWIVLRKRPSTNFVGGLTVK